MDDVPYHSGDIPDARAETLTLTAESAGLLMARLEALAQAARVFGSGVAGVDVDVGWSLRGGDEEIRWTDPVSGRGRVRVQLDLGRVVSLLQADTPQPGDMYLDAFKAGFLHELGHILYSGQSICRFTDPDEDPLSCVALDEEYLRLAARPGVRELLRQICLTLEDARVELRLTQSFRGARRFLEGHLDEAVGVAHGSAAGGRSATEGGGLRAAAHLEQLVGLLFVQIWGAEDRIDPRRVPPRLLAAAARMRPSLASAVDGGDALGIATWVGRNLMPEIRDLLDEVAIAGSGDAGATSTEVDASEGAPPSDVPPGDRPTRGEDAESHPEGDGEGAASASDAGDDVASPEDMSALAGLSRSIRDRLAAPDALVSGGHGHRLASADDKGVDWLDSEIIVYPHRDGRMVLDELTVASAGTVPPDERVHGVVRDVADVYGPMALNAFAGEAAALRRAFQVNFERRLAGRHRSGKRIGISNVRRFVVSEDLRLFQKMEIPDRLSYYFHLLVDVSPSMLTNKNAQKAIATAYAFAEALDRLRVPVDVTLYSAAITVLYDHRAQGLDRFFGGNFGYLSSGTHEIEAIAYAKQKADGVAEERKVLVVLTDGRPNSPALRRAGFVDLKDYYQSSLIPWLDRQGIDLMAIGIGMSPSYHRHFVSVGSSWDSIGVLMRLLDDIIARGQGSHLALWR